MFSWSPLPNKPLGLGVQHVKSPLLFLIPLLDYVFEGHCPLGCEQ